MNENNKNSMIDNIPRLQWACRRGMLELDVLLNNFLNEHYSQLEVADKKRFVWLLEQSDPELFAWLLGHEQPDDADLQKIIEIIRRHARSRF